MVIERRKGRGEGERRGGREEATNYRRNCYYCEKKGYIN